MQGGNMGYGGMQGGNMGYGGMQGGNMGRGGMPGGNPAISRELESDLWIERNIPGGLNSKHCKLLSLILLGFDLFFTFIIYLYMSELQLFGTIEILAVFR
ncbi:unnamed protein product [Rotaria sp. Silwood2]|nr:unnamed protein product [Rotaria sp. Silwood2]